SPRAACLHHQAAGVHDEPRDSRRVRHRTRPPRRIDKVVSRKGAKEAAKAQSELLFPLRLFFASLREKLMNFQEAVSYLLSLGHETLTIKLGLRNTELLLNALDNPERSFNSVQIAGTNGKGSTAAMLDSVCRAAGIKTGLYTSPHLVSITERIKFSGNEI